jgi:hypothetical protein
MEAVGAQIHSGHCFWRFRLGEGPTEKTAKNMDSPLQKVVGYFSHYQGILYSTQLARISFSVSGLVPVLPLSMLPAWLCEVTI